MPSILHFELSRTETSKPLVHLRYRSRIHAEVVHRVMTVTVRHMNPDIVPGLGETKCESIVCRMSSQDLYPEYRNFS